MRAINYTYHIDLDEHGYFNAHVENTRGRTIIAYELPVIYETCEECGESFGIGNECNHDAPIIEHTEWDIFDPAMGIVKHKYDIRGLERHYKESGIMPQSARLVLVK